MRMVFAPAVRLLNQLTYPRKFGLIGLLFGLPLGLVTFFLVRELNDRIEFSAKEQLGNEYLRPVQQFASDLRDHRGLTWARADHQQTPEELRQVEERLQRDVQEIDKVDRKHGETLRTTPMWIAIKDKWRSLPVSATTAPPVDPANRHTVLIADLLALMSQAGDQSNLILDPDLDSYYLMDLTVSRLPLVTERIGQVRGFRSAAMGRETTLELDHLRQQNLASAIEFHRETLKHHLAVAFRETHDTALSKDLEPTMKRCVAATDRFLELIDDANERPSAEGVWQQGNETLAEYDNLYSLTSAALDRLLQARVTKLANRRLFVAAVTFLCALLVVYLFVAFYLAVMRTVAQLDDASQRLISGQSNGAKIHVDTQDELGQVTRSFGALAAQLVTANAQLAGVLDAATQVSIISTDVNGLITVFNSGAQNLLGYSADEMIGKQTPKIIHVLDEVVARGEELSRELRYRVEGFEVFVAYAKQGRFDRREWTYVRKDGSLFTVSLVVTAVKNATGEITGFLGVAEDITLRKQAERHLLAARESAEQAARAKGEFLANMSHEIRTPMNGIIGMADLALDTTLTSEQREYLEVVKLSANSLLRIINDILDFSKIEAGKLELDPYPFRLRDSLGDTMKTLATRAHEKELELLWQTAPDVPDGLIGDAGRLRQILVNLSGNAIKFTERGEVSVSVELVSLTDSRARLRFSVRDTGIGIPQDKQRLIFEAFSQADASTSRAYGGTGLGLSISRQLVRLMGGDLSLKSDVGKGSSFFFEIELPLSHVPADASESDLLFDLTGVRVLVVDDNQTNRRILELMLKGWKMQPTLADGGPAALEEMRRAASNGRPFDLVLTDCHMPHMDGFMFVEELKKHPELARSTIMMLTSADRQGAYERCHQLGIAATLLKPLKQLELRQTIVEILGNVDRSQRQPTPTAAASHSTNGLKLRLLLAEDNRVNQQVAIRMLNKLGHDVTVVEDGQLALDALQTNDFDVVLMDVQMPVLDGFKAVAAIREQERSTGRHQLVIAMTAHAMSGDRKRCLDAGMDDYVSKPISATAISEALTRAVEGSRAALEAAAQNSAVTPEGSLAPSPFDFEVALAKFDGDRDFLNELFGIFLQTAPEMLASLNTAVARCDVHAAGESAHLIKGTVANFCANPTYAAALRLEEICRNGNIEEFASAHHDVIHEVDRLINAMKRQPATSQAATPL